MSHGPRRLLLRGLCAALLVLPAAAAGEESTHATRSSSAGVLRGANSAPAAAAGDTIVSHWISPVAGACTVLVVALAFVAAAFACVSAPDTAAAQASATTAPRGKAAAGAAGTTTDRGSSDSQKKKNTEMVRNLPNKKQAFKRPVTRASLVQKSSAASAAAAAATSNATIAGSGSSTEAAKQAPTATGKNSTATSQAANAGKADNGEVMKLTPSGRTRNRAGSAPSLPKATAATTTRAPSSGVRRLRSATVSSSPSPAPCARVPAPRVTRSKSVAGPSKKQMLLQWCQSRIEPHVDALGVKPGFPRNFSQAWKSGKALMGILYDADPSSVPLSKCLAMTPAQLLEWGFALAESKYGVSRILDVEDLTDFPKPDVKCVLLYATLLHKGVSRM